MLSLKRCTHKVKLTSQGYEGSRTALLSTWYYFMPQALKLLVDHWYAVKIGSTHQVRIADDTTTW